MINDTAWVTAQLLSSVSFVLLSLLDTLSDSLESLCLVSGKQCGGWAGQDWGCKSPGALELSVTEVRDSHLPQQPGHVSLWTQPGLQSRVREQLKVHESMALALAPGNRFAGTEKGGKGPPPSPASRPAHSDY